MQWQQIIEIDINYREFRFTHIFFLESDSRPELVTVESSVNEGVTYSISSSPVDQTFECILEEQDVIFQDWKMQTLDSIRKPRHM